MITSHTHSHTNILIFILFFVQTFTLILAVKIVRKIVISLFYVLLPDFLGSILTIAHNGCLLLLRIFLCHILSIVGASLTPVRWLRFRSISFSINSIKNSFCVILLRCR